MKTVKEVVDEYLNRHANPKIDKITINIYGDLRDFVNPTNLKVSNDNIEFDYPHKIPYGENVGNVEWKHVSCKGHIVMKVESI